MQSSSRIGVFEKDMKVILALNDIHRDGMSAAALILYRALNAQGVDVTVLLASVHCDLPEFIDETHAVVIRGGGWGFVGENIENMVKTVNEISEDGDVLIHFGAANWLACVPYLKLGIRVVTAVHSINPSTLKICRAYPERVSAFVCISKGVMDRFLRKLPRKFHHKVHLIPNAVDVAQNPKTDWSNDGVLRILFLGRIEATSKGCDKLPKIMRELKSRGIAAKLDLYGYFHNWESQWWRAVDKSGVRDVVEYKGEVAHENVYDVMRDYDVFISPSNFEGFPLSCSEAMGCALPVVVSRIVGVTDWICDYGRCGVLVKKMDIGGFADALEMLAKSVGCREKIGHAARMRIMELASFESHGQKYAELVRFVFEQKNYVAVAPHCQLDRYVQPDFLKSWAPARILPTWLKSWLRRFL